MSCCEKSRVMLVGTGGYAGFYLETLEKPEFTQKAEFVCAVDPFCAPETKERLEKQGVRVFDDMQTAVAVPSGTHPHGGAKWEPRAL